jgi:D-alanyl-D-alanine carboxypeptidase
MPKRLLTVIGILLLLGVLGVGLWTFKERHQKKEIANVPSQTQATDTTKGQTPVETAFDKTKYSLTDPSSIWIVVNKERPLNPLTYAPADLVSVGGGQLMRKEAADALTALVAAAKTQGLTINSLSGYRSYANQVTVYNNEVKNYGQAVADSESAKPGYSEHQTGFAIDVGGGGCGIEDCFGNTAEGKWVAANAYSYGFIVRYTAAKQSVTGYRAEPWHIRYIGTDLSEELHKENTTTLEEFFNL